MKKIDVTVLLPILNEDENIEKVIEELNEVLASTKFTYEILGINTPDKPGTFEILEKLGNRFENFYPINMKYSGGARKLQKGYQYLLGFMIAKGEKIVHMDSDYEDDPRDIPNMIAKLDEGYDLVVGWRTNRKHTAFYRFTSKIYNSVANAITGVRIHDKNCGIKAYRAEAAKALSLHGQNFRGIPLLLQAKGYRITEIPVNNRERLGGKGHWNFWTRFLAGIFDLPSNILISRSSDMPFRFWGGVGYFFLMTGFVGLLAYGYKVWFGTYTFEKVVVLISISMVLFILGFLSLITGILMEYILDQKHITLEDFSILDDPKDRVKT
ncbi:MAG: glycosyltransferase [bacterium]